MCLLQHGDHIVTTMLQPCDNVLTGDGTSIDHIMLHYQLICGDMCTYINLCHLIHYRNIVYGHVHVFDTFA